MSEQRPHRLVRLNSRSLLWVLFEEVTAELLGWGAFLEEVGHWGQTWRMYIVLPHFLSVAHCVFCLLFVTENVISSLPAPASHCHASLRGETLPEVAFDVFSQRQKMADTLGDTTISVIIMNLTPVSNNDCHPLNLMSLLFPR